MSGQVPTIGSRLPSTVPKRDIMWNIIEPGDPYDIRKSMIAKLPGRKNYMGEHLQLVCLLQAAEIERLCEYLEEHRLKLREVERRELDRHSYEVQIKELTQRISDEGSFRAENLKLRDFLRKQSAEFEDMRKRAATGSSEQELLRRYEEALRQIDHLMNENEALKDSFLRARQEYQQGLATREAEIEALNRRLKEGSQAGVGRSSDSAYRMEVEAKKLEFENRRLREAGDARARELQEVQGKCKQLIYQLEEQSSKVRQLTALSSTIQEYESRFTLLGEEIDRLNNVLREKTAQAREAGSRCRGLEEEVRQQGSYIAELEGRKVQLEDYNRRLELTLKDSGSSGDESRSVIRTYEANLQKLSLQIQRLNKVLRMKMGELEEAERTASDLEQEVRRGDGVKREVEEFRSRFSELNRRMAEYENRIAISTQEIDRLNQVLRRKSDEAVSLESQLKTRTGELENAQGEYSHLEIESKAHINYLITNYEARIEELQQQLQLQDKTVSYSADAQREIERLGAVITRKDTEVQQLRSSLEHQNWGEAESRLTGALQENQSLRTKVEQYESRIVMLSQEIERLNAVIRKTSPSLSPARKSQEQLEGRKLTEYENKLSILNQEIDRLNDSLRARDAKIKDYEQELDRRRQGPQSDNEQTQRLAEAGNRISILTSEVDRLNDVLKRKTTDSESLEQKFRNSSREADDLRRKLVDYEHSMEELSERARGSLQLSVQYEIDGYKRKIAEQEKRISDLDTAAREAENKYRVVEQQSRTYEQQSRGLQQQSRIYEQQLRSFQEAESSKVEGSRRESAYQSKIVALSKEIERLNTVLERFNGENQDLKRKLYEAEQLKSAINALEERLALAAQENESLRKTVNESYQSVSKSSQQYDFRIRQAATEKEQAVRRVQEQDLAIQSLQRDVQYANSVLRAKTDEYSILQGKWRSLGLENESLSRRIQELSSSTRKMGEYDSKMVLLSEEIDRLNGILRAKLDEVSTLEGRCRHYEGEIANYQRKAADLESSATRELQARNMTLAREGEQLRTRVKQLAAEAGRVSEFENKMAQALGEVERLNSVIRAKLDEIDSLSGKLRASEQELDRARRRSEELESTMHRELKNQAAVFQQRISQLSDENEAIRRGARELSDANRVIPELEGKLSVTGKEVERLNGILTKLTREVVPALEEKAKGLALECDDYRQRCSQLGESSKQALQAAARLKLLTSQNEQLQRQLQDYQGRITNFSAEIERLNIVLRNKLEELVSSQAKLRQAVGENEQLGKRFKDSSEIVKRVPDYEAKIALLSQQLERLNGLLRSKGEEVASAQSKIRIIEHDHDSLQRRNSEHESTITELKRLKTTLEERVTGAGSENEELRRSIRELADSNRRLSDYESRITLLSQEVQRLNTNLRMKTDELTATEGNWRNSKREAEAKITALSSELDEYRRKASENIGSQASRLSEYEGKMLLLSKEIQRLNIVLKETSFELEGSHVREKQCLQEIERLNNTLRIKVEETTRWEQANSELKAKLRTAEQSLASTNGELEKARGQYGQLAEEYKKSNQHMVEYEQSINKLYQEFQRLQSIIQSLKKENYDLKLSLQQAGNLVEKNRHLSAEIDRLMQLIEQQTTDLEELRLALADESALQKRINEYMALMVVLFAEIESLRRRVKDTEKEIQDVRRSSLAPFKV